MHRCIKLFQNICFINFPAYSVVRCLSLLRQNQHVFQWNAIKHRRHMHTECKDVTEAVMQLLFFSYFSVFFLFLDFIFFLFWVMFSFSNIYSSFPFFISFIIPWAYYLFMFLAWFSKETGFTWSYHVCIGPAVIILNLLANFNQTWQSEKYSKGTEFVNPNGLVERRHLNSAPQHEVYGEIRKG